MTEQTSQNARPRGWTCLHLPPLALLILLFAVPLFSSGCERRDAVIAGVAIPIPSQMKKIPDKVFDPIPGFNDGQATYEGRVPPGEIFTFYQENMAARGWQPTSFMVDQKDQVTYTKGNRVCLIWDTANDDETSVLTILVGTLEPAK